MRRKVAVVIFGFLLVSAFLVNLYSEMTYNMNAVQMLFGNSQLTEEDRAYLRARGTLIYGSDDNSPPLRFYDAKVGEYRGLAVDYLRALALELETEIEFVPMVWSAALEALELGQTDLCDMYPSKDRSSIYLFSDPIYYQRGILVVRKSDFEVKNVHMLAGKRVALQRGDYVHEYLVDSGVKLSFVFTRDYEESLRLLGTGEVDAIAGDEPVISYFLDRLGQKDIFSIVETPLYELPMVLSVHKSDKALQQILNKGITALTRKNTITKIQQKWFGISTPIGADVRSQRLQLLFLGFAAFTAFVVSLFVLWNLELSKAVKLRTRALEISRNNLETIIDGLHHLIVVIDRFGAIRAANRQYSEHFSAEHGVVGWQEIVRCAWENTPTERILQGRTYRITPYPIQYDTDHEPSRLVVFEDVTDQRLHAAKLLQDNKMAAIGQLATGVAHEIRNPLGLIRNYAFLLKRQPEDQVLISQALEVIEDSVDKASSTIDNLLNFSRLASEEITSFDVRSVVENVLNLNDKLLRKERLRCVTVLNTARVSWCEPALRHILMNLINNAVDAMRADGQLTLWLRATTEGASLHVIDTGSGMTEETRQRLFDPFYTTKQIGEGTGLGLYIVYSELEKHGGSLSVSTKPGCGTTFKLQLIHHGGKREHTSI